MMFPSTMLASAAAVLFAASAVAAPEPSEPSGTTVAAIGSELTTQWDKDTKGGWTDTTIRLMSGNNFNFQVVTPLATGIDASQLSSYTFKVPDVSPTSQIYFLLFNPTNATDFSLATYSTRFTISGADGTVTAPANPTQPQADGVTPGGAAIPWGVGNLTSAYDVTSPSNQTGSTGASASQSVAEVSSTAAASASSASSVESASAAVGSSGAAATVSSAAAKASSTAAAASSTGGAASRVGTVGGVVAFVGAAVAAGLML